MNQSLQPYLDWFHRFSAEYLERAGDERPGYQIKIDHTLRVLANASAILDSLSLEPAQAHVARVAALFHDAGRFPQMAGHHTFSDARSGDHGLMGVRALVRGRALAGLSRRERGVVLGAVFLHNKAALPANLPPALDTSAKLVRDADKLDIMSLVGGYVNGGGPDLGALAEPLGVRGADFSPEIARDILAGRKPRVVHVHTRNDYLLFAMDWIHDIHFPATWRLMRARGLFPGLMAGIEPSPRIEPALELLRSEYGRLSKAGDSPAAPPA